MAFSVSAFAVDVKVSGEYYAAGLYLNKTELSSVNTTGHAWPLPAPFNLGYNYTKDTEAASTAFFYQRLRVGTDFVVSPCLKLVTSFDAMERIWGGARSGNESSALDFSAGTRAETENIAFNQVYVEYASPVGLFKVGYMPDYVFGTLFGDMGSGLYDGQIQYFIQSGPFTGFLGYSKRVDNSYSAVSAGTINATRTDRDYDSYRIAGIYNFKTSQVAGETGLLFLFDRDATNRGRAADNPVFGSSYLSNAYVLDPYVKAKIGPVALQAEAQYWFGDAAKYEGYTGATNVSIGALSVFVDATATFGPVYVGGTFAYLSGDDPNTKDKVEGGVNTGGLDFNPCLIMFNTETAGYWVGPLAGYDSSVIDNQMSNAWFFQGRVGVKPTPQWDIMLAVASATADKKPATYANGGYGTEVDLTATYKITNNLSYMLGAGYLFTGDYFKGSDAGQNLGFVRTAPGQYGPRSNYTTITNDIQNDYIILNKLTLSF
jgi:hypothetical protein